jgi:ubiquitin-protein ligase
LQLLGAGILYHASHTDTFGNICTVGYFVVVVVFVDQKQVEMQVETILLSIISMLSSPNDESPANIDAAVSDQLSVCFALQSLFKVL